MLSKSDCFIQIEVLADLHNLTTRMSCLRNLHIQQRLLTDESLLIKTNLSSGVEIQNLVLPQTYLFWPSSQQFFTVTFCGNSWHSCARVNSTSNNSYCYSWRAIFIMFEDWYSYETDFWKPWKHINIHVHFYSILNPVHLNKGHPPSGREDLDMQITGWKICIQDY